MSPFLFALFLFRLSGVCGWQSALFEGAAAGLLGSFPAAAFPLLASGEVEAADWPLVGKLAIIIVGLAAVLAAVRSLSGKREVQRVQIEEPLPPSAPPLPRWATWEDVEKLRVQVTKLHDEKQQRDAELRDFMDVKFHELARERSTSTARLHERLETSAGELRKEIDTKIDGVRRELHDMPGKLVTLLRETGAIGGRKSA